MKIKKPVSFDDVLKDFVKYQIDSRTTDSEEYARQLKKTHEEFVNRNIELTNLLKSYIVQRKKKVSTNTLFRNITFFTFLVLIIALTAAIIFVFYKVDYNNANFTSVASLISAGVTYIGSILSIFRIMTKYLFPIDEEKDTIEMIKTVIQNDIEVEKITSGLIENDRDIVFRRLKEYKKALNEKEISDEEYSKLRELLFSSNSLFNKSIDINKKGL